MGPVGEGLRLAKGLGGSPHHIHQAAEGDVEGQAPAGKNLGNLELQVD